MLQITRVVETFIQEARRRIKVLRYGKSDTQTPLEAMPYGEDSNPVVGMRAIYGQTSDQGRNVILGYINTDQLAAIGEKRLFSTDADGNLAAYIWLKADGTVEILSDADNAVRYSKLEEAFNEQKDRLNEMVQVWNAFANAYVAGGPTVQGLPPAAMPATESTADIVPARIDEIKVPD